MKLFVLILMLSAAFVNAAEHTVEKWQGEPIKLDGKLTETAWKKGTSYSDFSPFTSEMRAAAEVATKFMLRYDSDYLYIGVECEEPLMEKVKAQNKPLWFADGVEFFFAPTGKDNSYYQFRVNVDKNRFQQYYEEGGGITPVFYAPDWDSAVALQDKSWSIEVRIPWYAFYMTDSSVWSNNWRLNVARNRRIARQNISWSKLIAKCSEIARFRFVSGFPKKTSAMDYYFADSTAAMNQFDGKRYSGDLIINIESPAAGSYSVKCFADQKEYTQSVQLKKGKNKIFLKNVSFVKDGKNRIKLILSQGNKVFSRQNFDVNISYVPVTVKLNTPAYRDTFYPGQTSKEIKGVVRVYLPGKQLAVTLGQGKSHMFPIPADGVVKFSIPAEKLSDGKHQLKFKVLPQGVEKSITVSKYSKAPEGMNVGWIENGKLIWNRKPALPRFLYAHYYLGGSAMRQRTDADDLGLTGPESAYRLVVIPPRLIKGIEIKEGTKDIRPCQELFDKLKVYMDKHDNKNFLFYYLSDEPECRSQSAVYLKHLYEFIKENDPWHPVMICTRAPERYIDCADILSPHSYIGPTFDGNGKRYLNIPIYKVRNYIRAVSQTRKADKIASYTGQFFSYKGLSIYADYPTFEELEAQVWSTLANGTRWYCNYAYHDLGDRPVIYEATRYQMTSLRALESFILNAEYQPLTMKAQFDTADAVLLQEKNEKLMIVVNLLDKPQTISVSSEALKNVALWYRFREKMTLPGKRSAFTFNLKPYECMVLSSKEFCAGLPTRSEVLAKIERLEKERVSRPNILLGRGLEIEVSTSNPPRSSLGLQNKLFDGTCDMLAWQHTKRKGKRFIELSFPKFVPEFSKVRLWGTPMNEKIKISIRKAGKWQIPEVKKVSKGKWYVEFDYGTPLKTIRMRIDFPVGKTIQEVYEIEFLK